MDGFLLRDAGRWPGKKRRQGAVRLSVVQPLEGRLMLAAQPVPDVVIADASVDFQVAVSSPPMAPASVAATVTIPDDNLREAIRSALNKPTGAITTSDMLTLTSLSAGRVGIADLTGLQYATNLKELYLSNNNITDLSRLSGLHHLTHLSLLNNQIGAVGLLKGLTSLELLYLEGNQISDVSNLRFLTNLTQLTLRGNRISDISTLGVLTRLTSLDLSGNQITNVAGLSGLTHLVDLGLNDNQLADVSPLGGLTSLVYLTLGDNNLSQIGPLSGLTSLRSLVLDGNRISDLSPLGGLTSLRGLWLSSNQIAQVDSLSGLTNLSSLSLRGNQITDIRVLGGLTNLTYLDLASNQITSVSALGALKRVRSLAIDDNQVAYITALGQMSALKLAKIANNFLNIKAGSPARVIIRKLQDRNVDVSFTPQNVPPTLIASDDNGSSTDRSATFADTLVGSTSDIAVFTLSNPVAPALRISGLTVVGDSADFGVTIKDNAGVTVSGASFAVLEGQSYTVSVWMKPGSSGDKSAAVTFNTNDPYNPSVSLNMAGNAIALADLSVVDDSGEAGDRVVNLPDTLVNAISPVAIFALSNMGQQSLTITGFGKGGSDVADFRVQVKNIRGILVDGPSFNIAGGRTFTVEIRMTSAISGSKSASIVFATNDLKNPSVTLSLAGRVLTPAALIVSDSVGLATNRAVILPDTVIGAAGAKAVFTLTNSGQQALSVVGLAIGGTNPGAFALAVKDGGGGDVAGADFVIPGGESYTIEVWMKPPSAGAKLGSISFRTNDLKNPSVALKLSGNALTPAVLSISDNSGRAADRSVVLPATGLGQSSPAAVFTLSNSGQQELSVNGLSVGGVDPGDFAVTVKDYNGAVVEGDNFGIRAGRPHTVEVRLNPVSSGSKSATITFTTNDLNSPLVTLNAAGIALPDYAIKVFVVTDGKAVQLQDDQGTVSFGQVARGQTGMIRTFRVTNAGSQALPLGPLRVPAGFLLLQDLPATLAPGRSAVFKLQLKSVTVGTRSGLISLASNDPLHASFIIHATGTVTAA